ncbi:SAM-dependent methyltransferase (plasmid) [Nonomuraea sp. NBC_00507]|uniref:N-6 DNA methylase n=1 Tax=Nonomuraea sp. NBC_00507 TaxID=2976002 RepID=UPI002E18D86D
MTDRRTLSELLQRTGDPGAAMRQLVNACAAARGLVPPFDVPAVVLDLGPLGDLSVWGPAELGAAYEAVLDDEHRAHHGTFFTPEDVALFLARFTLEGLEPRLRGQLVVVPDNALDTLVLDPTCGAGILLEWAAARLAVVCSALVTGRPDPSPGDILAVLPEVYSRSVFGVDLDPVAVEVAKAGCWLDIDGRRPFDWLDDNIIVGDALAGDMPPALAKRLDEPVPLIIIGNPPYSEHAKGRAPWLEQRRTAGMPELLPRPCMDDFRTNGRTDGKLSNLWTFFWRWAVWQALEARDPGGAVALLTPHAYLIGGAFAGMREHLRRVADEGWIVELSPEGHQAPVPSRIFPGIRTPVTIGIFARYGPPDTSTPACVRHTAVKGSRQEKFAQLRKLVAS